MPVITMTLGRGQMTDQQKEKFITETTQQAAQLTGIPTQSFTVFIEELPTDNIGVGGMSLTKKRLMQAAAQPA